MKRLLAFAVFAAFPLSAQILTSTPKGVVAAHNGQITLANRRLADGLANPTFATASNTRVAVLDALANEAVIVDLNTGRATRTQTAETPIAAAFVNDELYILARDARVLQRGSVRIPLAADPAFLRTSQNRLYVYSRTTGAIEEIERDRVTRRITAPPFASDFEIAGNTAYLAYPREGRIRAFTLTTLAPRGEIVVGAVPVDIAFASNATALTARTLAVADPSSKRVWLAETTQSTLEAFGRGFLRGFLGLGLFGSNRNSQFPTGIDRVEIRGAHWIAYDSSSGTLYRFTKRSSSVVATNVPPHGFTLTADGVAWWNGTSVAQTAFR